MTTKRCAWVSTNDPLMLQYHDREWGVPAHDDRKHFEFLVLEAAQAGLSWSIVLKKREGSRLLRILTESQGVFPGTVEGEKTL